jgi:hypothetical protein
MAERHLPGTARTGAFLFPSRLVGETSKQLLKRLEQALPVSCSFGVQAVALQGFLNLLVMDNFQADDKKTDTYATPFLCPLSAQQSFVWT